MPYVVKEIQTRYSLAHRIECSQHFRTLIGARMGKDVAHHEFSFTAGRSKNYCNHFERQLHSLLRMTQQSHCCCLPHRVGNLYSYKAFTWVFMAPFITDKRGKNKVFLGRLQLFFHFCFGSLGACHPAFKLIHTEAYYYL